MAALLAVSLAVPLLLAAWYLAVFLVDYYRKCRAMKCFPQGELPPHWFWGNLTQFRPDEESILRLNWYVHTHKFRVTAGWIGPVCPLVAVQHPDAVRKVIKEPKLRTVYDLFNPWLGKGLLTIEDGPKWHRNRHLLTPAFHFAILKGYVSVYNSCTKQLFVKWDAAASREEPVLLFDTLSKLSLDIILQCAFSFKSNCQKEGDKPPYIKGVQQLVESIADRFFNPLYQFDWLYFFTPSGRKMKAACKVVHAHAELVIKERRATLELTQGKSVVNSEKLLANITKSRKLDFLDILLTATDDSGVGLSDLEIRNEVDTFMFEGHDTTTSGMCWVLYCLAKYPEHQDKVREEVRTVLAGREWLEYDDLKELKFTQMCIKESLRLYPPVSILFRKAAGEIEVEGNKVPKGTWLSIPIYFLHHNPELWPDPEVFDPYRFEPSRVKDRDPYAYMAFSAGSRNCIGQNFALNEEKVVVASIVNRYKLSITEGHTVEMLPTVVLRAKYDIKLNLEPLLE